MSTTEKHHRNILISGQVQGVGFRYSARRMAVSLGIKGFAQNMHNGNVYIEAEGTLLQMNYFIKWCRIGPENGNVQHVAVKKDTLKKYNSFTIKH